MIWFVVTIVLIGSVTAIAAKLIVARQLIASTAGQVLLAAAAFPIVTAILAAMLIALQFAQKAPGVHKGSFGMAIFAIVMFWFYGLMASAVVGLPTAVVAVRSFQRG